MQFGMFFELQLPRPWPPRAEQELYRNALEWAELGERSGIEYGWAQEHHFLEEYSHSTAPEVFLAAVSQRTRHMRLGHGVTLMPPAFNHPARVAERIAALDLVSEGRVEWGTGESSSRIELEGFGVSYLEKRNMWAEAVREAANMMASEPYAGYRGKYFSMPARNVIPKPVQKPHPPLWVACTNRDTVKMAARLGMGALTFAFMDPKEARYWVNEYYETFESECQPIGRTVNPNVAMLAGVTVHPDADVARARGVEGQRFFKWALAWYYRFGTHLPGRTDLWDEFLRAPQEPMAGISAIGTSADVCKHFEELEAAGVDQVMLLQQAGRYPHEHVCETLEYLGRDVIPAFRDRHEAAREKKLKQLEPAIERALARIPPLATAAADPVESYPVVMAKQGVDAHGTGTRRAVDAGMLWRLHVAETSNRKDDDES